MVVVPSGSFMMGSRLSQLGREDHEGPAHRVTILEPYAIGKYEVTFAQWDACVAAGGCREHHPHDEGWGRGRLPVIDVSWWEARTYVRWLSRKTGKRYRLLSEAEWEYATRAGTTEAFYFGSTISTDQANYDGDYTYNSGRKGLDRGKTVPIGSFPPNAFGLHDVHGNVREWVEDQLSHARFAWRCLAQQPAAPPLRFPHKELGREPQQQYWFPCCADAQPMNPCLITAAIYGRSHWPMIGLGLGETAAPRHGGTIHPICVLAWLVAAFLSAMSLSEPARADAKTRSFAAHALTLRAEIVDGRGAPVLSHIPGGLAQGSLAELWPPFFENTMVALGRLRSPAPRALYYNPLLDVAVSTVWEKREGSWRLTVIRALPGERLTGPPGKVSSRPSWLKADERPVEALAATAAARLAAFHRAHPPKAEEAARIATTFAGDAADARATGPRLMWNARQRARWNSGAEPWLHPTLANITETLSAGDAKAVMAAAPATDAATAEAIAGLPAGFAKRLVLDMVLSAGEDERLLIGSLPDDGEMYFLVLCRLDGAACGLRRIMMVSLLDGAEAFGKATRK